MKCAFLVAFSVLAFNPLIMADDLHRTLLNEAGRRQEERRLQFEAVKTPADVHALQKSLRSRFLALLDGLPEARGIPPAKITGKIDADDYIVEKLVFESFPGYFVPAVLYKPRKITGRLPGVISPCGHSAVGKAASTYQILHINLVKRGYVVLSYDPVGQGERSQFWDAEKGKSRFNLVCGEHAVLGNPLYLLGTSLARYRIWDGIRAIDYLSSLPEVDPQRIGCVGNSGGGTLSAYIAALDARVKVAAICCYITTLPRRMGNRIQADPDADPEQDIFGFVSEGIDHAGLLALRAPRPTLVGAAQFDFFPIEGARESFEEAKQIFTAAGVPERIKRVEAAEKHGLSLPLRKGVYRFFERWLADHNVAGDIEEIAVKPRPAEELLVCPDGQVNVTFRSRHLLTLALEEFERQPKTARKTLRELLQFQGDPEFRLTEISPGGAGNQTIIVCINGNETRGWQEEKDFLQALEKRGYAVTVVDPRGVGTLRPDLSVKGHDYADPLVGVEENLAYNAFLLGKSLLGMRVADVSAAVQKISKEKKQSRIILCGRRDAGLVACLATAVNPGVAQVAVEETLLSYRSLFTTAGQPINAASILPNMLRDYGDVAEVLAGVAPRKAMIAASGPSRLPGVVVVEEPFSKSPGTLIEWLGK